MQKVALMICCSLERLFMWVYPLWSVYPDNLTFNIYFTSNLCLISITQKRHFPKLLGKCPKVQNLMKLNSPYAVKHAYFSIITHYYKQICCNFVAKSNYNISEITYFRYYSMIVATRPEPTVLPPSRFP